MLAAGNSGVVLLHNAGVLQNAHGIHRTGGPSW
jgi:hypothetical protein